MEVISWQYESWENYQTATFGLEGYHWRYDPDDPDAETLTFKTIGWEDENGTPMYMTVDGELSYDNTLAYFSDFTTSIGLPTRSAGRVVYLWPPAAAQPMAAAAPGRFRRDERTRLRIWHHLEHRGTARKRARFRGH